MKPFRIAILVLAACASHASAQPRTGEAHPDKLAFGTIYTGATVEASFMVYEAGTDANIPLEVTSSKFVKVLNKATHAQEFGAGNNFVCGSVEIAIDTTAVAELDGEVNVTLGQTSVTVPVSATVKARKSGLTRLLIAQTPFCKYSTSDGGAFKAWTELVNDAKLDVSYLLVTENKPVLRNLDLNKFDCVLLADTGLFHVTPADLKKVRAFAEAGGRVVVAANHFMTDSVKKANAVLEGYGIEMQDEEAQAMGKNDVTLREDDLDPEIVKAGVVSVRFFRASPVRVTDEKLGRVVAKAVEVGQPGDGFVAIGTAGKGKAIAIGQSLWWHWISEEQAGSADNTKLLWWLLAPGSVPKD